MATGHAPSGANSGPTQPARSLHSVGRGSACSVRSTEPLSDPHRAIAAERPSELRNVSVLQTLHLIFATLLAWVASFGIQTFHLPDDKATGGREAESHSYIPSHPRARPSHRGLSIWPRTDLCVRRARSPTQPGSCAVAREPAGQTDGSSRRTRWDQIIVYAGCVLLVAWGMGWLGSPCWTAAADATGHAGTRCADVAFAQRMPVNWETAAVSPFGPLGLMFDVFGARRGVGLGSVLAARRPDSAG